MKKASSPVEAFLLLPEVACLLATLTIDNRCIFLSKFKAFRMNYLNYKYLNKLLEIVVTLE